MRYNTETGKKIAMKFNIILIFSIVFVLGCGYDKRSKKYHRFTNPICNGSLYIEGYTVFGSGALGGNMMSDYLTDSANFRIYVGTYDDSPEKYFYTCKGDSIYIEKKRFEEDPKSPDASKGTITTVEKKVYSLLTLKTKKGI